MTRIRVFFASIPVALSLNIVGTPVSNATSFTFDYNFGTFSPNPDTQCPIVEYGGTSLGQQCLTVKPTKPGYFTAEQTVTKNGNTAYCLLSGTWSPVTNVFYHPKYQVMGVFYAPPGTKTGSRSSVVYGTTFVHGTTTNTSSAFTVSETITLSGKATIPLGTTGTTLTISNSQSINSSQTSTTSQGNVVMTTSSANYTIQGGLTDGIDHTQDVIRIWLNPIYIAYLQSLTGNEIYNGGVVIDDNDPVTQATEQMDTVDIPVSVLKQLMAGASAQALGFPQLERAWDTKWTNGSPALTPTDYQDILKSDPFVANPSLSPVNNARYDLVTTAPVVPYNPTPTPESTSYSLSYQTTTTLGQSAMDSHSVSLSVDGEYGTIGNNVDLKLAGQWTSTNTWSVSNSNGQTQSAMFTVWTPSSTDGYTGPHEIAVYKDNVYGTFVFYPVPGT